MEGASSTALGIGPGLLVTLHPLPFTHPASPPPAERRPGRLPSDPMTETPDTPTAPQTEPTEGTAHLASLTPRQIVAELDRFVIGQTRPRSPSRSPCATAGVGSTPTSRCATRSRPANIILIGPTGVGKTEIARRLAKLTGAPFVKVEATKFTEVGYVGRDVGVDDPRLGGPGRQRRPRRPGRARPGARAQPGRGAAAGSACSPRASRSRSSAGSASRWAASRPAAPRRRPPARPTARPRRTTCAAARGQVSRPPARRQARRPRGGARRHLDKTTNLQMFGPTGLEEMGINLQEMLGGMGKKRQKRRVKVPEAWSC